MPLIPMTRERGKTIHPAQDAPTVLAVAKKGEVKDATHEMPDCPKCQHFGNAIMPEIRDWQIPSSMVVIVKEGNMKIIAIANQKGGTAKTTTVAALAVLLGRRGTRVHAVDMDPQASLTRAFGLSDETDWPLYRPNQSGRVAGASGIRQSDPDAKHHRAWPCGNGIASRAGQGILLANVP